MTAKIRSTASAFVADAVKTDFAKLRRCYNVTLLVVMHVGLGHMLFMNMIVSPVLAGMFMLVYPAGALVGMFVDVLVHMLMRMAMGVLMSMGLAVMGMLMGMGMAMLMAVQVLMLVGPLHSAPPHVDINELYL